MLDPALPRKRKPKRIQRHRTKGWRMPEDAFYVGRPTMHGNPFRVGVNGTIADCVRLYRAWLRPQRAYLKFIRKELRGKDLACWCRLDQPCHADVLLELANG
jgi:hypothetical protein